MDIQLSLKNVRTYQATIEHFFPCSIEVCGQEKKCTPKPIIHWLPAPKPTKRDKRVKSEEGWLKKLSDVNKVIQLSYGNLEHTMCPFLASKYHSANISKLMTDKCPERHLGVVTWQVLHNEAFGLGVLHTMFNEVKEQNNLSNDEKLSSEAKKETTLLWLGRQNSIKEVAEVSYKIVSGPFQTNDCAQKASEFLFETSVLVQLPWNNELLHQWLLAALVEVLIFEKHSLELHYWPLPKEVEVCAIKLLVLAKKLKERVMLGFAILFKNAETYPEVNHRYPAWILDEVVLASLPTLQFLISGKAYSILKSIKKISWSCNVHKAEDLVYLPVDAYELDSYLDCIFAQFMYSVSPWVYGPLEPFASTTLDVEKLEVVIERINSDNRPQHPPGCVCSKLGQSKRDTVMEQLIRKMTTTAQEKKLSTFEQKRAVTNWCLNKLTQAGRIDQGRAFQIDLCLLFNQEDVNNVFSGERKTELQEMILLSMMNEITNALLHDKEKDRSVMSQVIHLGLEVVERSQLVRLIGMLYRHEEHFPLLANLDKFEVISVSTMTAQVVEVAEKQKTMKRAWLWNQIPAECRKSVEENKNVLFTVDMSITDVVKNCEVRVGKILYNTVQTCLKSFRKPVFPEWQTVQYIVPSYIATWLIGYDKKNDEIKMNILRMISVLLMFYEERFKSWQKSTQKNTKKSEDDKKSSNYEISLLCDFYLEMITTLQASHMASNQQIEECTMEIQKALPGLEEFAGSVLFFPALLCNVPTAQSSKHITRNWNLGSFTLLKDLYEICVLALQPQAPVKIQHCVNLGQYYSSDTALRFLLRVFKSCASYLPPNLHFASMTNWLTMLLPTPDWLVDLMQQMKINESLGTDNVAETILLKKDNMKEIYRKLKSLKANLDRSVTPTPHFMLENVPSNMTELRSMAQIFVENKYEDLDKLLPLLCNKKPKKPASAATLAHLRSAQEVKSCERCGKIEPQLGTFFPCVQCIAVDFPHTNYYCTEECRAFPHSTE